MKKRFLFILIILFPYALQAQQADKIWVCHVKDIPFSRLCTEIYAKTDVKVFYKESWVSNIKVTFDSDSCTALEVVLAALKGTKLLVSEWHGNLVVLPEEKLLTSLPSYTPENDTNMASVPGERLLTGSEERYITGRKADVPQTIRIGRKGASVSGNKVRIQGRITEEETGEPIFSVTMSLPENKTGTVSDINGSVSLMLFPGLYNAQFDYLGYERKKCQLEILSDGNFTVSMRKSVIQMKEVVVYGDRQMSIRSKDPGLDKMSIKTIKELPMMMGERDILKVSGTLPGIVSVGEGSAGLNVRGGGSDQNAFYINKIPIYNTSHLFGFFPAFNADIIKDFSIYKGHIPAQYGGHLSSVFNIVARQGNRKRFTARGGISPVTGNLVVEGPLKKDTCSFILSARSSYSDWILKKINDPDISNSSTAFSDISGGINYDIPKTQLSLFAYHSNDRFSLSDLNSYKYSNNGASVSVGHNFGSSLRSEFSVIASQYLFSTTDKQIEVSAYDHSYKMEHYEAKAEFKHILSETNSLDYGLSTILYKLNRGKVVPYGENSIHSQVNLGTEQGIESAVYISDAWEIFKWLNLTTGFRYALFTPLGPKDVYEYTSGLPKNERNIIDTLSFKNFEPICRYKEPDLRIALNIETDDEGSIKLAFNQMHQNLFMLNTTTTIAPNTQWKLADYHLLPSRSNQWSAGVFRSLPAFGLEASAELYYKQTRNYPEFRDGADFLNNPAVETSVLQGDQTAWGIEVFLKRSLRKFEGWISYTYSRSKVNIDGGEDWNRINNGLTYPANFDIPHVVNVVLSYHVSRRVTFATIITYQSGKPVTYPVSVYYVNGYPVLDYSKRNAYRIPDYFRSDFSLTIEGNLKKKKLLHSSVVFSLYNASGRDNPYSVFYKTENGYIRSYQYSVISVPVFTATWLFKLGNYASE